MDVLLTTVTVLAAVPPRLTVAPDKKPVPLMVTAVPPLTDPDVGEIAITVGAGATGATSSTAPMSNPVPCGRAVPKKSWLGAPVALAPLIAGEPDAIA